jgi:acetyl/propionyl-CoA carboxylase alpha subunit
MNTRIQVEHPVTELVTGIDLVKAQIEIAAGGRLPFKPGELRQNGWAIECRVYAEDPEHGFVPAPGRIDTLRLPEGPGVRNDCGVYEGSEVSSFYDPMISKLVTWGRDRNEAIGRMRRALSEYLVSGTLTTNLSFHRWLMDHPRWIRGEYDTRFINEEYRPTAAAGEDPALLAGMLAAAFAASRGNHRPPAAASGREHRLSAWKTVGRIDSLRR